MHILLLTHYFPPEVNAPATRSYEHCKEWVSHGHRVTVITCAPNCPSGKVFEGYRNRWRTEEDLDGIRVIRVWTLLAANRGFAKRILNYLSFMVSAVFQAIRLKGVDIVIASSPQFFCGWAGVLCHWIRRWPFVLEIRDIWPESIAAVGSMRRGAFFKLLQSLERRMYQAATIIVTVGEGYVRHIEEAGVDRSKIEIVTNGVNLDTLRRVDDGGAFRKRINGEGRFVCGYIGTIGLAHGLEVVLDAAEMARDAGQDDILFCLVGDGARCSVLKQEADARRLDNVVFTGLLPRNMINAVMTACDACLVHLAPAELFSTVLPSKVFELMALDVPIIMGVGGQAGDIVLEAGAGVQMIPGDPVSLLSGIEQVKLNPPDAFRGRDYIERHYDRKVLAKRLLDVMEQVAG